MKILNDSDVMKISPGEAVGVMERVFREKSDGYFFSPHECIWILRMVK